mmetsp:Transcript_53313/g.157707  ORF Transcript_53313/g.157707 Transcript_53313/m.157707 type:complete len:225 (-) Transcript_53313:9-683(-)
MRTGEGQGGSALGSRSGVKGARRGAVRFPHRTRRTGHVQHSAVGWLRGALPSTRHAWAAPGLPAFRLAHLPVATGEGSAGVCGEGEPTRKRVHMVLLSMRGLGLGMRDGTGCREKTQRLSCAHALHRVCFGARARLGRGGFVTETTTLGSGWCTASRSERLWLWNTPTAGREKCCAHGLWHGLGVQCNEWGRASISGRGWSGNLALTDAVTMLSRSGVEKIYKN